MKCVPPSVLAILLLPTCTLFYAPWSRANDVVAKDAPTAEQLEFFEAKIRPVLIEQCYECHSGTNTTPKGGLRLDRTNSCAWQTRGEFAAEGAAL